MHTCPKGNNHPNCQWNLSTGERGQYIRATGGTYGLHSSGGSQHGYKSTLYSCPTANNHGNCQWKYEVYDNDTGETETEAVISNDTGETEAVISTDTTTAITCNTPSDDPSCLDKTYRIKSSDANLCLEAQDDGRTAVLSQCTGDNAAWKFEKQPDGRYYIRNIGKNKYAHASGGVGAGKIINMHTCPKGNNHPNCQWNLSTGERGQYIRATGGTYGLHSSGGSQHGYKSTLYSCPTANNHGNCQWKYEVV